MRQLEHVHSKISEIEEMMFTGQEKEMVKEISFVQRDALEFQRAIHAHNSVLKSLSETDMKNNRQGFSPLFKQHAGRVGQGGEFAGQFQRNH